MRIIRIAAKWLDWVQNNETLQTRKNINVSEYNLNNNFKNNVKA